MKKIRNLLAFVLCLTLAVTFTSIPGSLLEADAVTVTLFSGTYTYEDCTFTYEVTEDENGTEATITGASSESTSIVVPDTIDGATVTAIDDAVFKGNTTLQTITLPDGITSLGESAFYGCTALTSIDLPDGITSIQSYTFYNCSDLEEVDFPESLTSIKTYAFYNCESLKELPFPNTLTAIYEYAFANCPSITYVRIPSCGISIRTNNFAQSQNVETIEYAEGCERPYTGDTWETDGCFLGTATTLILPSTLTTIATGGYGYTESVSNDYFADFTSLTTIEVSEDNPYFADYDDCIYSKDLTTLYICAHAKDTITFSDACTTIEAGAFYACNALTEVEIPDTVTTIIGSETTATKNCYSAFKSCTALEKITVPDSVTYIGPHAFTSLTALTDVSLYLDGVQYHLYGEDALTVFEVSDSAQEATAVTDAVFDLFGTAERDAGSLLINDTTIPGDLETVILPASTTSIQSDLFEDMTALTAIEVDSGNTVYFSENGILYQYADESDASSVTLVRYPAALGYTEFASGLTTVGARAFYNCSELSEVTFEAELTTVEEQAFYKCSDMVFDFTESGLTTIGDQAFYNAFDSKVLLPDTVSSIGEDAFYTTDDTLIVYCNEGTYAETYAIENDILYRALSVYGTSEDTAIDKTIHTGSDDDEDDTDTDDGTSDDDSTSDGDSTSEDDGTSDDDSTSEDGSSSDEDSTSEDGSSSDDDSTSGDDSSSDGSASDGEDTAGSGSGSGTSDGSGSSGSGSDTKSGSSGGTDTAAGTKVTIGSGVYQITGSNTVTYVSCTKANAAKAVIPASVTINGTSYKVTVIAANAFAKNTKLKSVVIGKNVKTIGKKAFYNCKSLKKITFKGKKVKKIGAKAFKGTAKKAAVKVPKAKKAAYQKLLKKAGLSAKAKVK